MLVTVPGFGEIFSRLLLFPVNFNKVSDEYVSCSINQSQVPIELNNRGLNNIGSFLEYYLPTYLYDPNLI